MSWFFKDPPEPEATPEPKPEFLKPGECECGHGRCFHREGKYDCKCAITDDHKGNRLPVGEWGSCACVLYIPDDDDDDDDQQEPTDPSVEELERMSRLK